MHAAASLTSTLGAVRAGTNASRLTAAAIVASVKDVLKRSSHNVAQFNCAPCPEFWPPAPALLQPQCSLLASAGFHFTPSSHASIRREILIRRVWRYAEKTRPALSYRIFIAKKGANMATPETFSETGSETMYEKVSSSVISKPDVVISLTAGALGCMEFARGGPRLRARKLYAAGNPFAHALAASTAAPRAGLPYASSLTRPSLGPMSAKKPSLRPPRERTRETTETTPTPKPMTRTGPREAPVDAREPHGLRGRARQERRRAHGLQGEVRGRQGFCAHNVRKDLCGTQPVS